LANGFACLSAVYVCSGLCILISVLFFYQKDLRPTAPLSDV